METRIEASSAPRSILLIEDDKELCSLMSDFLTPRGFSLHAVHDGARGLARALEGEFDLVILDAMLPLLNGFELLRTVRKRSAIPIIMLTARVAQDDRLTGLNSGADDYITKPFPPEAAMSATGSSNTPRRATAGSSFTPASNSRNPPTAPAASSTRSTVATGSSINFPSAPTASSSEHHKNELPPLLSTRTDSSSAA